MLAQIRQYRATQAEFRELLDLMETSPERDSIQDSIRDYFAGQPDDIPEADPSGEDWQLILHRVLSVDRSAGAGAHESLQPAHRIPRPGKWRWVAAAAIVILLAAGAYLWTQQPEKPEQYVTHPQEEVLPGKQGAILTLADGSHVVLDSLGNGVIATQGSTAVKLHNGQVRYEAGNGGAAGGAAMTYNTMTTPRGRQYQLVLPDGTQVWLNSGSSLTYPTAFSGKERRVTVSGEAYFEVAKNIKMPFRVNVNSKAEVEVLGTHFNVNAYEDEANIQTTLLEGSVKVNGTRIRPGQQAQTGQQAGAGTRVINDTDIEKVMAWKNGLFNFRDIDFDAAMRQLERWYDVEVVYEQGIPKDIELDGELSKDVTLNDLLVALAKVGVKCRLEGRKLVIRE